MTDRPFAYAWRWKGFATWKLTLTKKPNHHPDIEIKELFESRASEAAPAPQETCARCMGNGEIVTDWETSLHPPEGATEDAVADCPECYGTGHMQAAPAPSDALREALETIRDGYGTNHLSKFALAIASAALSTPTQGGAA